MELKNYMEDFVLQKLDSVLKLYPDCCDCPRCRQDIAILALNHLPPKYVSTDKGGIFARLEQMSISCDIEVLEEVAQAIEIVSEHPRHGDNP